MSTDKNSAIYEYEEILLGKKKNFTFDTPGKTTNGQVERRKVVEYTWNYAIGQLLGWTGKQAQQHLSEEIVNALHLNMPVKHIDYPAGIRKQSEFDYPLGIAFPDERIFSEERYCINEYKKVMRIDEYSNAPKYNFRKKFFEGEGGLEHAGIILNYLIVNSLADMSLPELYAFFADEKQAMCFLKKKKMHQICKDLYDTPLDFFHYSISAVQQDDVLYYYNQILNIYNSRHNLLIGAKNYSIMASTKIAYLLLNNTDFGGTFRVQSDISSGEKEYVYESFGIEYIKLSESGFKQLMEVIGYVKNNDRKKKVSFDVIESPAQI